MNIKYEPEFPQPAHKEKIILNGQEIGTVSPHEDKGKFFAYISVPCGGCSNYGTGAIGETKETAITEAIKEGIGKATAAASALEQMLADLEASHD